ncbi:MAG: hypothetical protein HY591_06310 [Candidatus Omnitrophica bacterium]|nr:hypothetical protein [Candidatus Omnitrophota bacterium]
MEIRNIGWFAVLAVLEAVQLTALLSWILSFIRVPQPLAQAVVPEWRYLLDPEWESAVFRFFIAACIGLMCVFVWLRRGRAADIPFMARLKCFMAVEAVLTVFLLSALFKKAVYQDRPALAAAAAGLVLALAFLNKIFWPFMERGLKAWRDLLFTGTHARPLSRILTGLMPLAIFFIIDVPNVSAVAARAFFGEQFHHNDSFIFGPALAYINGCVADVDTISQYGPGVGVIFGSAMRALGGFSYEAGFLTMIYGTIIYYIMCFFFLRQWLASAALAAAGVLFMLKIQMFNTGVYPFVFTYGSATVLRYWFDILFFFAVAAHIRKPSVWSLAAAGCACGAQLFYIPSDGVYLTAAYYFYICAHLCLRSWRDYIGFTVARLPLYIMLAFMPVAVAFVLLRVFITEAVWTAPFWRNVGEFIEYFISGFGVTPIYSSLLDRQFLASLMGFVVPGVYVLTLLTVGSLLAFKKIHRRHILVCVLCVYGLGLYHYYVARSAVTSYYVVSVPYAMVLCFWGKMIVDRLDVSTRLKTKVIILVLCVWALWTNHNFLSYPNRFNFSRDPVTDPLVAQPLEKGKPYFNHLFRDYPAELKVPRNSLGEENEDFFSETDFPSDDTLVYYYRREADFSIDAALIARLTDRAQAVPLISSFEIKILMQAQRKPYFYYFPLVISHPMRARNFVRTSIYTVDQLNRVIQKLEEDKPPYVFMERLFLTRPVPRHFYHYYSSMMLLTDHVIKHYTPVAEGRYLTAMKRVAVKEGGQ